MERNNHKRPSLKEVLKSRLKEWLFTIQKIFLVITRILKPSRSRTSRRIATSRREILRAGAIGGLTIALQPLLEEPPLPKAAVSLALDKIGTALQELATGLAQAKEWREAERVALSIEDNGSHAPALQELVQPGGNSGGGRGRMKGEKEARRLPKCLIHKQPCFT